VTGPVALYGAALRRAAVGGQSRLDLVGVDGVLRTRMDAAHWSGGLRPGDHGLLSRCTGATLDVGCGPGRLTAALTRAGRIALGVDISAEAVRQTRRRGAPAIRRSVFQSLPREGRWQHILLADGNIGIGGDPRELLRRCLNLITPHGGVLAEVAPPGSATWSAQVVLSDGQRHSDAFPWASVAANEVVGVARASSMRVRKLWTEEGRWFAYLVLS
jgi:SAM-dependent methyltransferase